jgi:16S rRNA (uracil1498-N3)-methyltransferase
MDERHERPATASPQGTSRCATASPEEASRCATASPQGTCRPPAELVAAAAHLYSDDLEAPSLSSDDAAHLSRSLRLRDGEAVTVSDGRSAWRMFRYRASSSPTLEPDGEVRRSDRPSPAIGVGFALTSAAAAREVARSLTEVGVDVIVPVICERSGGRWEAERLRRLAAGLRRVVREAGMQARRIWLPEVREPIGFDELVEEWDASGVLAHPSAVQSEFSNRAPDDQDRATCPPRLNVIVGPEGGFSAAELDRAKRLEIVSLGPCVLRVETAAVVAGARMVARRHGLW